MDENELIHGMARLTALKANLPDHVHVPEKYVTEYHDVLEGLERAANADLRRYRVPDSELRKVVTSSGPRGTTYSRDRFCDRPFLMMKIDGVLTSFQLAMSEERPIGFKP